MNEAGEQGEGFRERLLAQHKFQFATARSQINNSRLFDDPLPGGGEQNLISTSKAASIVLNQKL